MRTQAAVAVAAGRPPGVMEVGRDRPRAGRALAEIRATGVRRTDASAPLGERPEGRAAALMDIDRGVRPVRAGDCIRGVAVH